MPAHLLMQSAGKQPATPLQRARASMKLKLFFEAVFVTVLLAITAPAAAQQYIGQWKGGAASGWARAFVDANGDGRDDYCYLAGDGATANHTELHCHLTRPNGSPEFKVMATGLWAHNFWSGEDSVRWADVNGDGFIDVCRLNYSQVVCRLGPTFSANSGFDLSWASGNFVCLDGSNGCYHYLHLSRLPNIQWVYFADVSGDQLPDLCYVWNFINPYGGPNRRELRCRIASVSNNRLSVTYAMPTAAWTFLGIAAGAVGFPRGFYDFNGDGRSDFCRVIDGGSLRCTLAGESGFVATEVGSPVLAIGGPQGASFVDVNADGNIDYCRLVSGQIRCTLSDGLAWRVTNASGQNAELISPALDAGHEWSRWWVDINADGFPDFCRLASSPNPIGDGVSNVTGNMLCRLSRGGGDSASSNVAFVHSDVFVNGINLGRADGGRSFCDVFGTGIPTLCRVTTESLPPIATPCELGDSGAAICYEFQGEVQGYLAGYRTDLVPARGSVLTAFSEGLGAETRITYLPLTHKEVYSRSNTQSNPDERILLMQPRSLAVFETRAWLGQGSGTPLVGSARYFYADLRADTWGGSRGFRERWVFHEGANTLEHVVYFQGLTTTAMPNLTTDTARGSRPHDLRELGIVMCQGRYAVDSARAGAPSAEDIAPDMPRQSKLSQLRRLVVTATRTNPCSLGDREPAPEHPFVLLQTTTNTLADTAPDNPRLRHVGRSEALSWDWNGSARVALPRSETITTMTPLGNVMRLEQITRQDSAVGELKWEKLTVNAYDADDTSQWLLGRLTRSTVTTKTPTAANQLAANGPRDVGSGEHAGAVSWPRPPSPPPTPISPAALAAIIDLLLQD